MGNQEVHADKYKHMYVKLYARNLSLISGDNNRDWAWKFMPENSKEKNSPLIEVAELVNECPKEVKGEFDASCQLKELEYEVVFKVMLKNNGSNWKNEQLTLKVEKGDQTKQHTESLERRVLNEWIELQAGKFNNRNTEKLKFSLSFANETGHLKKGLVVMGVDIRPILNPKK